MSKAKTPAQPADLIQAHADELRALVAALDAHAASSLSGKSGCNDAVQMAQDA